MVGVILTIYCVIHGQLLLPQQDPRPPVNPLVGNYKLFQLIEVRIVRMENINHQFQVFFQNSEVACLQALICILLQNRFYLAD